MAKTGKLNIAIITPTCKDYMQFINDNPSDIKEYTWVHSINIARGRRFDDVIKLYQYYKIDGINEVLEYLESHMKPEA